MLSSRPSADNLKASYQLEMTHGDITDPILIASRVSSGQQENMRDEAHRTGFEPLCPSRCESSSSGKSLSPKSIFRKTHRILGKEELAMYGIPEFRDEFGQKYKQQKIAHGLT